MLKVNVCKVLVFYNQICAIYQGEKIFHLGVDIFEEKNVAAYFPTLKNS